MVDASGMTLSQSCDVLNLVVATRTDQAAGIISVELVDPQGAELPAFEAGAHLDVHLGPGLVRQYSLCGEPSDRTRYRLGILLDPRTRGGSRLAHEQLVPGARARVSRPINHFPLAPDAERSLLLAGGIGVTPLICMAYQLRAAGRPFELHYCTRSEDQTAFADELKFGPLSEHVRLHRDDGPDGQRLDLASLVSQASPQTHLYVCGPAGYIEWVLGAAKASGWTDDRLHREYFAADVDTAGGGFTVVARRSGRTVQVAPDQTIAAALIAAGIDVPLSCEEGVCGTCLTGVLEGAPDHRDVYLSNAERASNSVMMVCCSRAQTAKLVLDL